ncbi:MAG: esterase family protein [Gammaproteobacteria bacterium]|nr:esterase family protein [Gammaproteobacteria bacterium]
MALAPQVTELRYHSDVLDRELNLLVVTPPGVSAPAERPVVFFLHGLGRNPRTLFEQETTRDTLLGARVVTVHPAGLAGWYLDSRDVDGPRFQAALAEAIVLATEAFSLTTDPRRRGLGGWSMGGFGAARYAVDHPHEFGALGTILGLLDFPNADLPADQNHRVPAHFGPAAGWPAITPLAGIAKLTSLAHWQGTGDQAFDRTMNERWDARLTEMGVVHTFPDIRRRTHLCRGRRGAARVLEFFATSLLPAG